MRLTVGKELAYRLNGLTPCLSHIICKSPCPAPTPPGCIPIAHVPGILQDAGETLRDHEDVRHRVFNFPRNTEMTLDKVLHPLQVHTKLLSSLESGTPAIVLTRGEQILAAKIKESLLLKSQRGAYINLYGEQIGQ